MGYLYLMISIICELFGTSMLKASAGFTKLVPTIAFILGFACAFTFLSLSLKTVPLNVAYAIWSGIGTVATVILSILIWKEKVNMGSIVGIVLIIIGVVVLQLYGPGQESASEMRTEVKVNR